MPRSPRTSNVPSRPSPTEARTDKPAARQSRSPARPVLTEVRPPAAVRAFRSGPAGPAAAERPASQSELRSGLVGLGRAALGSQDASFDRRMGGPEVGRDAALQVRFLQVLWSRACALILRLAPFAMRSSVPFSAPAPECWGCLKFCLAGPPFGSSVRTSAYLVCLARPPLPPPPTLRREARPTCLHVLSSAGNARASERPSELRAGPSAIGAHMLEVRTGLPAHWPLPS